MKSEQNKKKYKFLRITSWFLGVMLFLILLLIGIALIFEDNIAKYAINQINKEINTEIKYKDLSFSLIKKFPYASLKFTEISAKEVVKSQKKNDLLHAKSIYLQFNIWDLISGKYDIKRIEIENADIKLKNFADGTNNFQIFKKSTDTSSSKINFALKKIILRNVDFEYNDYKNNQLYKLQFKNSYAKGNFSEDNYDLNLDGKIFVNQISIDSVIYLKNKETVAKIDFNVNNKFKIYTIKKGKLNVSNMPFLIKGNITYSDLKKNVNLSISGDDLKLHSFIEELPINIKQSLSKFETQGDFRFDLKIKGDIDTHKPVSIEILSTLKNGKIINKDNNISLDDVNFSLKYLNGDESSLASSSVLFDNFSARLKSGTIKGKFKIKNFAKPLIQATLSSDLNLADLEQFLKHELIISMAGQIKIDVILKLQLESWNNTTPSDFINSASSGTLNLSNANVHIKDFSQKLTNIEGDFRFNNSDIIIDNLSGNAGESDFNLRGSFQNILPFLFLNNQKLDVVADFSSKYLNFDELFKAEKSESKTGKKVVFSDLLNFDIELNAQKIKFGKFTPTIINANLIMNNKQLKIKKFTLNTFNGSITGNGSVDGTDKNKFITNVNAEIKRVDVSKMFYSFNNFGQKEDGLTDKKIKGIATAKILMFSVWNSDLTPQMDKLKVSSEIVIENGELVNYETLKALSRFVKLEDLEHVKFSKLKNKIEIKENKLIIPEMDISSNAMNLQLSGVHKFNNEIEYHIKIRLSELLSKKSKKIKKNEEEFADIEDDGLERNTIYILITGLKKLLLI